MRGTPRPKLIVTVCHRVHRRTRTFFVRVADGSVRKSQDHDRVVRPR
jgi:hypothetical protein